MKRRATLKVEDAPAPIESTKIRCRSCGVGLPPGQIIKPPAKYYVCSYCIGDPYWGKDGYLFDMIQEELEAGASQQRANLLHLILCASNRQHRRQATRLAFRNAPA